MLSHLKTASVAAAVLLALAGMAQATPINIANSSFESPDVSNPGYDSAPSLAEQGGSGWNWTGSAGAWTNGLQTASIAGVPNDDGSQVFWSNGGAAFQTTGHAVKTGEAFTLMVDIANRSSAPNATYRVALYLIEPGGTPTTTDIVKDDQAAVAGWTMNTWKKDVTVSYTYTGPATDKVVGVWLSANTNQAMFDKVRLDVTPEPATMALLAAGGIGVLLRRRR